MKGTFPRVTHPSATISFDLHVLGLPPAFVLSQNQTLKLSFDLTNHPLEYGRLLCCISISIAFFDENPFKQKEDRSLPDGKKNSQETHRRDRLDILRCPQAITPPAFLFLSLTMSNSVSRSSNLVPVGSLRPRPEVAAYTAAFFPVNHLFSLFCSWPMNHRKRLDFERTELFGRLSRPRNSGVQEAAAYIVAVFLVNPFYPLSSVFCLSAEPGFQRTEISNRLSRPNLPGVQRNRTYSRCSV